MNTELSATFVCFSCMQVNDITVDPTEGLEQTLIEDCSVCCRPNQLRVTVDEETEEVSIEAEPGE